MFSQGRFQHWIDTNLNLYSKKKTILKSSQYVWTCVSITILGLLLCECEKDQIFLFITITNPNFGSEMLIVKYFYILSELIVYCCCFLTKKINKLIFMILIMCFTLTYASGIIMTILLIRILNTISQLCQFIPSWVPFLLIITSNDTERNPGPHFQNNFFNFMSVSYTHLTLPTIYSV